MRFDPFNQSFHKLPSPHHKIMSANSCPLSLCSFSASLLLRATLCHASVFSTFNAASRAFANGRGCPGVVTLAILYLLISDCTVASSAVAAHDKVPLNCRVCPWMTDSQTRVRISCAVLCSLMVMPRCTLLVFANRVAMRPCRPTNISPKARPESAMLFRAGLLVGQSRQGLAAPGHRVVARPLAH